MYVIDRRLNPARVVFVLFAGVIRHRVIDQNVSDRLRCLAPALLGHFLDGRRFLAAGLTLAGVILRQLALDS